MSRGLHDYFLPYQVRWITEPAPFALGEKSRRIGWTYASSYRAVERRVAGRGNLYYNSADLTAAREFIDYCKQWAAVLNVVAHETAGEEVIEEQRITSYVLTFKNGRRIVAGSSNPKFFRGKGGDADGDEFAYHRDPRELFKSMQPASLVWGHQLRLWSTHNGEDNYFAKLLQAARAGQLKAAVHRVTILDAVEQGLVEKIRGLKRPDARARQEWLDEVRSTVPDADAWNEEYMCQPSSEQTSLLSYPLIQGCEVQNLQLARDLAALPQGGILSAGFDVGRKRDLSALWVLEKVGDVFWTRMVRTLEATTFTAQEELLALLMRNRAVRRLCVDATGIGAMLAERLVQRFGYRVEAVTFTAPVKSELAMPLLRLFQDKLVRVPAEPAVREDLHKVRKIVTASNNVRLDADRDEAGHADRFWALALAYHAADDSKLPLPRPLARKPLGW
jgi:phage FluMu gp28-like protein